MVYRDPIYKKKKNMYIFLHTQREIYIFIRQVKSTFMARQKLKCLSHLKCPLEKSHIERSYSSGFLNPFFYQSKFQTKK